MNRGVLYTYSGRIAFPEVAPSLMDIAVSLSREGRYAGAGVRFWPVALHTFCVCDLLPTLGPNLLLHGLLHDAAECITGDIPKPAKTDEIEEMEVEILTEIYKHFGLRFPSPFEHKLLKQADEMVKRGEVYTVGTQSLQDIYERCPEAEERVLHYVNKYTYADYLDAGGLVPMEFMRRFRAYKDEL